LLIAHIPTGPLAPDFFRLQSAAMPVSKEGEMPLKARYISIDAAIGFGCRARPTGMLSVVSVGRR
jgi:NADPH-dependent curcumin reductase CurA